MKWTEADIAERGLRVSTEPLERTTHRARVDEGASAVEAGQHCRPMRATPGLAGSNPVGGAKPGKYRNTKSVGPNFMGGERVYRSQWEAEVARQLRDEMAAGQIRTVLPEVSFIVGQDENGRDIRHRVDFGAIDSEGRLVLVEAKGFETPNGRTKRGVLNALGLTVQIRTKTKRRNK